MTIHPSKSDSASDSRLSLVEEFRRAAGFVPTGVAVISTPDVSMTVSSLHCVSFDPPLISVALSKNSSKAAGIFASGGFHVRLLRGGEEELSKNEGTSSRAGIVEMECSITASYPAGDHDLILAAVSSVALSDGYPLIYWRRGLHEFRPRYEFIASREAFQEFVDSWEGCTLPKNRWTHAAHVAIGACYAVRYPEDAFERTRTGIIRYNESVGTVNSDTSGYHETLTRWWAITLARFVTEHSDPWKAACCAVEEFGEERDLHRLYFGFDVVKSVEARRAWIPPDRQPRTGLPGAAASSKHK